MSEIAITTLLTNLPTIIVFSVALYMLRGKGGGSKIFSLGIFLILSSGLLAMPSSAYMWEHHESFMATPFGTATIVTLFGLLHSAGLLLCLYAFISVHRNAT
jgi:hypothetical protein